MGMTVGNISPRRDDEPEEEREARHSKAIKEQVVRDRDKRVKQAIMRNDDISGYKGEKPLMGKKLLDKISSVASQEAIIESMKRNGLENRLKDE